jgi:ABC-type antimicrobial peptide transport system permease subunit
MKNSSLINLSLGLLVLYNALYWPGKFLGMFAGFYQEIRSSFYMFCFLELLIVASVFVDIIVRFDTFSKSERTVRMLITVLLFIGFILRFGFGFMEDYLGGEVR